MNSRKVTRREFFHLAAVTAAGSVVAACAQKAAPTAVPAAPTAAPAAPTAVPATSAPEATVAPEAGGEAPMLAELVEAGELPPLQERLPPSPKIITPFDEIGVYCDSLRSCALGISGYICTDQYQEPLFEFPYPDLTSGPVEPNLAESWEFNEEGTVLTVHLRQGVRWSDGEPFTAEDVMFLWEDVWFEEDSLVSPPGALFVDGEPPELEMVDDFTLRFTFPRPFFYAEHNFGTLAEWAWPKHYMKEFHPKYNPDATWEAFASNTDWWAGRGKATLQAWMLEDYSADVGLTMVRNPYYWKVDTAGNQLPYADRVVWSVVPDRPMIALKCVAGEIDYDGMWVGIPQIPLFFEEKEARGFDLGWYEHVVAWAMWPNYDYPDPTIRNVIRDVNFRRAVSLALDRNEMNKTFYYDQAILFNACFNGVTPFFTEECARTYSEYNPGEAKGLLDQAGYNDANNDGFRETPDGKPLELILDVYQHDLYVPLMEAVVDYLAAVGLKAVLNIQLQDAIFQRRSTDEVMFSVGDFDGSDQPLSAPATFIPVTPNTPWWHKKASEEPFSPEYAEFVEIFRKATSVPRDEMIAAMQKASMIMAENAFMWSIGSMRRPYFIGKGTHNVPKRAIRAPKCNPELRPYQIYVVR
jgi:peptide/nickel transport system substrate-binding protein